MKRQPNIDGSDLRAYREDARHGTVEEVAARAGITEDAVRRLESKEAGSVTLAEWVAYTVRGCQYYESEAFDLTDQLSVRVPGFRVPTLTELRRRAEASHREGVA